MHSRPDDSNELSLARQRHAQFPPRARARHLPSPLVTAHRCPHIGYEFFDPSSWHSDCAPDTDDWMVYPGKESAPVCGTLATGSNYAQEFWGCSDITIESGTCILQRFECVSGGADGVTLGRAARSTALQQTTPAFGVQQCVW